MTSDCLSSLPLTKEEETNLTKLIAKDCLHSKLFLLSFRSKPEEREAKPRGSASAASSNKRACSHNTVRQITKEQTLLRSWDVAH